MKSKEKCVSVHYKVVYAHMLVKNALGTLWKNERSTGMKLEKEINQLEDLNIETLVRLAHQEKVEITLTIDHGCTELRIEPWKPISYNCPFNVTEGAQE